MREQKLCCAVAGQGESLADLLWQVLVGELHLVAEDDFSRLAVLGDDPAPLVCVPQGVIQPQDGDERGETKLAGLED